jgi:hypothetical protein
MIEETDDVLAFVTCYLRRFFKHGKEGEGQTRHPKKVRSSIGMESGSPTVRLGRYHPIA